MTSALDIDQIEEKALLRKQAHDLHDTANKLEVIGLISVAAGGIYLELNKVKAKLLPPEKISWLSWGNGTKMSNAQPWALMAIGVISFITAFFTHNMANKKEPGVLGKVTEMPKTHNTAALPSPEASPAARENKHVERYQNEAPAPVTQSL